MPASPFRRWLSRLFSQPRGPRVSGRARPKFGVEPLEDRTAPAVTPVTLGPLVSYSAAGTARGIVSGDFNRDGIPDLFTAGDGVATIHRGNGNGTFTKTGTLGIGGISV